VNFLNGQVRLLPGAITIAQLTGAPVLAALLFRSSDWRQQVLVISPHIPVEGDTTDALARCLAVVENAIRRHPAHWKYWRFHTLSWMGLVSENPVPSGHAVGKMLAVEVLGHDHIEDAVANSK
jgi:lauroyl/myristoyl acyltransferase